MFLYRFGRKKVMMCGMMTMLVAGVTLAFSENIIMFIVLRFFLGASAPAITHNAALIGENIHVMNVILTVSK